MGILSIDGVDIEVTRKAIRFLRLRIRPPHATVCLSVPWHATQADVLHFVTSRSTWIQRHRAKILAGFAPLAQPQVLADGVSVRLWGRGYTLCLEQGSRSRLECEGERLLLRVTEPSDPALCARVLDREYRKLLVASIRALAVVWSPIMGVALPEVRVRSMKTRWGSCNPRAGRVWISTELTRRNPKCLEYVMVHELAHLLERGHTDRFRAILDRHLPDWRQRRSMLNNPNLAEGALPGFTEGALPLRASPQGRDAP